MCSAFYDRFQSTHSQGVRLLVMGFTGKDAIFQSTHSQGVRQQSTVKGAFFVGISIHALTRSATYSTMFASCSGSSFQSTHSQGVRPPTSPPIPAPYFISIHALTRSATWSGAPLASTWVISIHALTRSATSWVHSFFQKLYTFQSTHSQGVRLFAKPMLMLI